MKAVHRIAVIPGDGVGKEVVPAAVSVLDAASSRVGVRLDWTVFPWGCDFHAERGRMMPLDGIDQLREYDAIFMGAVGWPSVPDHVSLWGLLIPIRRGFEQYINLRPISLLDGIESPVKGVVSDALDFVIVRENTEGEYSEAGGRMHRGTSFELAVQETVFTRTGVDRVIRYAFSLAGNRSRHLTSATKSNGILHTMPFWDERFAAIGAENPDIRTDQFHIDALCAYLVQRPGSFDVIVASNLFGDILSDIGAAVAGSIGIAPSGNINPERTHPSMFEAVHGSAPDIAGRGVANPVGQIWAGAMMLDHLGHPDAARLIKGSIASVIATRALRTRDLGGVASTAEVADAIARGIADQSRAAPEAAQRPSPGDNL
jgi:tartrate dehydrogenase/decarboxylase/D-malate dehydrogenase